MKKYDVECPVCGKVNHNLFLAETDGWYECDRCGSIVQDEDYCTNERTELWNSRFRKMATIKA